MKSLFGPRESSTKDFTLFLRAQHIFKRCRAPVAQGRFGWYGNQGSFALPCSRTYRVVKSNCINDHEFFQVVFVWCVVPMPSYNIVGGVILAKQRDRRLPHTFKHAAHVQDAALFQVKSGFSTG